jgi:hypothetical protein
MEFRKIFYGSYLGESGIPLAYVIRPDAAVPVADWRMVDTQPITK